jgi:hypothetical protein
MNNSVEDGEADGPYSLPSQSLCREGGALRRPNNLHVCILPYDVMGVNAGKPTGYYVEKIPIYRWQSIGK